jgi:UDPglucose--hexose-1-phosphate uridylyltransferase
VARERERMRAYYEQTQGHSLMQDLLAEEVSAGDRLVALDDDTALICPFAAATPYRMWILPRRPEPRFEDAGDRGAAMLQTALAALRAALGGLPPLNLWVRTAPPDAESFGWRIEIAPRLGQPAGMELGTGVYINVVPPETSAATLRQAL